MKFLWYQLMNSAARSPDDEGGGGGGGGDENQAETHAEQGGGGGAQEEGKQPASRFAGKGLGKFASEDGGGEGAGDEGKQEAGGDDDKGQKPDWLNPRYKTVEDQAKAYNELYKKHREGKDPDDEVPADATVEAYFGESVELDPEVDRLGLEIDDPGLKVAADVFKKYGIGKKTGAAIVKDMFKGMNEHAPTPIDPEQELKALGPNGRAAIDGTLLWLEKLDREGKLSDEDAETAIDLMGTARGVKLLNKLRGMTGERSIPVGGHVPNAGGMSPEEWQVAYMEAIKSGDAKEQERLDKISAGVFGTGAASGSPLRGIAER